MINRFLIEQGSPRFSVAKFCFLRRRVDERHADYEKKTEKIT